MPIAGNVDTRLRRLREGADGFDAIVLARAGLQRLGRERETGAILDRHDFVPAPGQGTLALEGRAAATSARARRRRAITRRERAHVPARRASARRARLAPRCDTPLGAHATLGDGRSRCARGSALPDGSAWVRDELSGDAARPEELGRAVAARMRSAGAGDLLRAAEEMTVGGR